MDKRKIKRVTVQVSERERLVLEHLARESGSTVSDYVRRIAIYLPYKDMFGESLL